MSAYVLQQARHQGADDRTDDKTGDRQLTETGILLALTALAVGGAFWALRRTV